MKPKSAVRVVLCSLLLMGFKGSETARFFHIESADVGYYAVEGLPGLGYAVLQGDPGWEGDYVIRLRIPPGQVFPPHFHDQDRHITVLSGEWAYGTGNSGDCADTIRLGAGAYVRHPRGAVHFEGACGERTAEIQVTGRGPVNTTWVQRGARDETPAASRAAPEGRQSR